MGRRDGDGESLLAGVPECVCWTCVWWLGKWSGQDVSEIALGTCRAEITDAAVMLELASIS
jgi:hypothetical protein